ncbi:hypothetical protein CHH61_03920 [Shouchella clausii]|jgi:hypothetical protein|uniref:Uncharacterized protein n=1 Tax=Shouchella clausii TaxID=79880 RepID=A0A268S409_SHOCL|nr:hypothetical protein [Shouchella clausii]PAF27283.1 hypothetical protein CHH61_03920 [Shouchella clausii]
MNHVSETKRRMAPPPSKAGESSLLFKGLQKQIAHMQQLLKEQSTAIRKSSHASVAQTHTLERIHDRLDAFVVESRVTNMLLSELVAIHQTIVTEDTDGLREAIRDDAYHRVRNAE